jgi:Icc protein
VFAVEDTAAQVTWRSLPAPEVTLEIGDRTVTVAAGPPAWLRRTHRPPRRLGTGAGGPGALDVDGLEPGTEYDVCASAPGMPRRLVARVRTLPPPPGRLLSKVATLSDCHLGAHHFGALGTIEDRTPLPPGWEPHPLRCARAALAEAVAWGADLVVVKGDVTADSEPAEFREAGRLLGGSPVPVVACLGNHDDRHRVPGAAILAGYGIAAYSSPAVRDLPGVRVVLGHTPHPRLRRGYLSGGQARQLAALAGGSAGGALVFVHHQLELSRWRRAYPPGVARAQSRRFLAALADAQPHSLVSAGHTHRCRRHQHGPVTITEVGSTKDYPGVWGGYAVYEGGVRQVVKRVAEPSALAWTETGAAALGGLWGRWAPGALEDRCFTAEWA